MNTPTQAPVDSINETKGNTPLVRLSRMSSDSAISIWGKLESFNPGGSAKDRSAAALLEDALMRGQVSPGGTVIESSSGNLGVALARECALRSLHFHCVVDPRANSQTVATMAALGATVHHVTQPDPETGDWLAARQTKVAELLQEFPNSINLDQYSNQAVFEAHSQGTMREIVTQLGHAPSHLFVAVSTTGTIGGCLRYLREIDANTKVIAVDAMGSVLYDGTRADRVLPGFGAGVVPELSRQFTPDDVIRIDSPHAIAGARLVAQREGFLPGASGGAVAAAFLSMINEFDDNDDAVLIFHDQGNAYLDTVYDDDWVRRNVCEPESLPNLLTQLNPDHTTNYEESA